MKKAIILSGPQASGKSWIASAISNFFPKDKTLKISFEDYEKTLSKDMAHFQLIIIEECPDYEAVIRSYRVNDRFPNVNLIMMTQAHIEVYNRDKFQLISCDFKF
jgi:hypothetical protein